MPTYRMDIDYGKGGEETTTAKNIVAAMTTAIDWATQGNWTVDCRILVRVWSAETTYYGDADEASEVTVNVKKNCFNV